jgi:hypothetical protein
MVTGGIITPEDMIANCSSPAMMATGAKPPAI